MNSPGLTLSSVLPVYVAEEEWGASGTSFGKTGTSLTLSATQRSSELTFIYPPPTSSKDALPVLALPASFHSPIANNEPSNQATFIPYPTRPPQLPLSVHKGPTDNAECNDNFHKNKGAKLFLGGLRYELVGGGKPMIAWLIHTLSGGSISLPESFITIHSRRKSVAEGSGQKAVSVPTGCVSIFVDNLSDAEKLITLHRRAFCGAEGIYIAASSELMEDIIKSGSLTGEPKGAPKGPAHPIVIERALGKNNGNEKVPHHQTQSLKAAKPISESTQRRCSLISMGTPTMGGIPTPGPDTTNHTPFIYTDSMTGVPHFKYLGEGINSASSASIGSCTHTPFRGFSTPLCSNTPTHFLNTSMTVQPQQPSPHSQPHSFHHHHPLPLQQLPNFAFLPTHIRAFDPQVINYNNTNVAPRYPHPMEGSVAFNTYPTLADAPISTLPRDHFDRARMGPSSGLQGSTTNLTPHKQIMNRATSDTLYYTPPMHVYMGDNLMGIMPCGESPLLRDAAMLAPVPQMVNSDSHLPIPTPLVQPQPQVYRQTVYQVPVAHYQQNVMELRPPQFYNTWAAVEYPHHN